MPPRDNMHEISKPVGVHDVSENAQTVDFGNRLGTELSTIMKTALPTLACMVLYRFPWLISLRFVGEIGADELAAAALASTLCNVTGLSLAVGLSSAITTLTGQARGDLKARLDRRKKEPSVRTDGTPLTESKPLLENSKSEEDSGALLAPLVFLYRGLFIQLLFVLPIGIWWISGVQTFLIRLGQGTELSTMTAKYLRILTPGLWSYSINWTLTAWLQSIEMADVPAWASAAGLVFHVPCNMVFINVFGWGYLGVAAATVAFQLLQPVLILSYLFLFEKGRTRLLRSLSAEAVGRIKLSFCNEATAAVSSRSGIWEYLSLAIPGIISISEWWASEVAIFLAGRLQPEPVLALGGMTLYQSLNSFCFMFPVAFSVAGSTRVSNLLGEGRADSACFAGYVSVCCAATVSGLLGCILFFTPHSLFPSLFAPTETALIYEASLTVPLLSIYVFADGIQNALNGIIKGCGRQTRTMPVVFIAYWVVGLPLAFYLAFIVHDAEMCDETLCGVVGLVAGMTTGTWLHMILFAVVVYLTNWETESVRANKRLKKYHAVDHPE